MPPVGRTMATVAASYHMNGCSQLSPNEMLSSLLSQLKTAKLCADRPALVVAAIGSLCGCANVFVCTWLLRWRALLLMELYLRVYIICICLVIKLMYTVYNHTHAHGTPYKTKRFICYTFFLALDTPKTFHWRFTPGAVVRQCLIFRLQAGRRARPFL